MILFPEGHPVRHETFDEYRAHGGYTPIQKDILQEVIASGIRGRGGAGFPVGKKWTIAAETPSTPRYVVSMPAKTNPAVSRTAYCSSIGRISFSKA